MIWRNFLWLALAFLVGAPHPELLVPAEGGWSGSAAAAQPRATVVNTLSLTNRSGAVQRDYPFQLGRPFLRGAIANFPQVMINGAPTPTQADVKNRWPDGSVKFAVIAVVIPSLSPGKALTLTFANQPNGNNQPLTQAEMLDHEFDAGISLTAPGGAAQTVSAREMISHGAYKLWTQGQVAQTAEIADDSAAATYDIGFDGSHHPFRPRFYATFWPATHQVMVRFVGEASKTTELSDLGYHLALTMGSDAKTVYSIDLTGGGAKKKKHSALTGWTKVFWLGGKVPEPKVDIDYNLGYLASTRFIANYDPGVVIPESTIAAKYGYYSGAAHNDVFDSNIYTTQMSSVGGREELGPYPAWNIAWLYTGDWRMREMSSVLAGLAAGFPMNLRETASGKRLSRYDPAGSSTGLGHTASITDRQGVSNPTQYLLLYNSIPSSQQLTLVGPVDGHPAWSFSGAHEPSPFYIPYLLTGDPWYLDELYNWAGFAAFSGNGTATVYNFGRGPTGAEGGISDETRGLGWVLRSRAETAFIAPDADPEKAYFSYLVNDALARWEGVAGITGTAYQTAPPVPGSTMNMWQWGKQTGNHQAPYMQSPSPLHMWESLCNPATPCDASIGSGTPTSLFAADVGSDMSPWMQNYFLYGLARAKELGFAAGPLVSWTAQYNIGMTLDSGLPIINALYRMPVARIRTTDWYQTWPQVAAALNPSYANGSSNLGYSGGLPGYFASQGYSESYLAAAYGAAALIADEPRGDQNWAWFKAHQPGITNGGPWGVDPRWYFAPRTDSNTLPAISRGVAFR